MLFVYVHVCVSACASMRAYVCVTGDFFCKGMPQEPDKGGRSKGKSLFRLCHTIVSPLAVLQTQYNTAEL